MHHYVSYFDGDCYFCCLSFLLLLLLFAGILYVELDDIDGAEAAFNRYLELDTTNDFVNSKVKELKHIRKLHEKKN